jgi:hypothetical protein
MSKLPEKEIPNASHREELLHRIERITEMPLLVLSFVMIPLLVGPLVWEMSPAGRGNLSRSGLLHLGAVRRRPYYQGGRINTPAQLPAPAPVTKKRAGIAHLKMGMEKI